jgi:hypothetical protein
VARAPGRRRQIRGGGRPGLLRLLGPGLVRGLDLRRGHGLDQRRPRRLRRRRPPDAEPLLRRPVGRRQPGTLEPLWCGAIAQLEEHLLCKQGVRGSSPLSSTCVEFAGFTAADALASWVHRGLDFVSGLPAEPVRASRVPAGPAPQDPAQCVLEGPQKSTSPKLAARRAVLALAGQPRPGSLAISVSACFAPLVSYPPWARGRLQ